MTAPNVSSNTTDPQLPALADAFAVISQQFQQGVGVAQPSATQTTLPRQRLIAGQQVLVPQRQEPLPEPDLSPSAIDQLQSALGHIIRDPLGAVVGMGQGILQDLWMAFAIMPEELDDPQIQQRLRLLQLTPGMALFLNPTALRPLAEANKRLVDAGLVRDPRGERFGNTLRLAALAVGSMAGAGAGAAIGPTTTFTGRIGAGLVEGVAFGTAFGAMTPLEEGQTRAGNIITSAVIAAPLGTLGGVTSFSVQRFLARKGIKPTLEVPEVTPTERGFNPRGAVRADAPFIEAEPFRPLAKLVEAERRVFAVTGEEIEQRIIAAELAQQARVERIKEMVRRPTKPSPELASGLGEEGFLRLPKLSDIRTTRAQANAANLPPGGSDIIGKLSIGEKQPRRPFSWNDVYTKYFDDLHPINTATKDLLQFMGREGKLRPGQRLAPIEDPYILARLQRGSVSKATSFLESGPLDFKTLQPVGPGMREILRPVVESNNVDALRAFLVSQRAVELQSRGIKTPFNEASAKSVIENTTPQVRAAAQQVLEYQNNVLKYLENSGLLSAEQVKLMRDANQAYVPFYRFVEESVGTVPPGGPAVGAKRLANLSTGIRRIKGGEKLDVIDPLESIVRNTYAFVQLADRQAVSDALIRLSEQVPGQQIVRAVKPSTRKIDITPELRRAFKEQGIDVSNEAIADFATTFRPRDRLAPGQFWVVREGRRQFFETDPQLWEALLDLGREQTSNLLVRAMSVPARTLRAGATLSPGFITRNPLRDQFWAAVSSKYGFTPVVDLGRGIFTMAERGQLFEQFRRSGAEGAALVRTTSAERASLQRQLDDLLRSKSLLADTFRTARGPTGWLEGLRIVSETMENATRSQEFVRALAREGDPRLAAFAAREVTLDFARMGTQIRLMNQLIPFFNATIQSVDKGVRVFRDNPVRATTLGVGYITLPSMALYFLNHDDPSYNELSEARRDFFWNFPQWRFNEAEDRMERTGDFISLPKPFELGLVFGTYPERVLRWLKDNDPEAFDQLASNTLGAFTPSLLPTAVAVPVEAITGYSFFRDRQIVPEREKRLLPEEQAGPLQGETVRLIGKALGVSPRIVENTVRGLTGGLGEGALDAVDLLLESVGVKRGPDVPRTAAERTPLIGPLISQFVAREPTISSKSVERFYRNWEQIEGTMNTVRELRRQGRGDDSSRLAETNRVEMASYPLFSAVADRMSVISTRIRRVRADTTLSREERDEQMLLLGRSFRTLAGIANDGYRQARLNLEEQAAQGQQFQNPAITTTPVTALPEDVPASLRRQLDSLPRLPPR